MMHSFIKHSTFILRWLGWTVFAVILFFSLSLLLLRYWLLPDIERYRPNIAAAISQVAGRAISIESIDANWDGLRPYLQLHGVRVHDRLGVPVLILTELDGTLSWRSLLYGELRFRNIRIERPALIIRRDAEGVMHMAGGAFDQEEADNGFFDWLLRQRQLVINDADVYWLDELRAAPVLYLKKVNLHMHNKGGRHRFGLRATPPVEVAAPLEIRGDFTGKSVNALGRWRGRLFAQLDHVDLAALQTWLSFPQDVAFNRGRGAFRAWIGMEDQLVTSWTADVDLHEARMQWAKDLPRLDLAHLRGRMGWKRNDGAAQQGEEWFARQLSIAIENEWLTEPVNILWRRQEGHGGTSGENTLWIDDLDLGVIASLASYLPIEDSLRKQLGELSPKGEIERAQVYWQGDWTKPSSFRVEGRFRELAMNDLGKVSSVSGMSGKIKATHQGGTLSLDSDKASMKLLEALDEPLELDRLIAQADWQTSLGQGMTLFELNRLSFSNNHMSGTIHGRYRATPGQPSAIDLEGKLANAEINYLNKYRALLVDQEATQDWLGKAIVTGRLAEARFHVRGELNEALSEQRNQLALKLSTKITDATVNLPEGWPNITNIQANLSFQNNHLDMTVSRARMADIVLKDTRLQIAEVHTANPILQLTGNAEGATQKIIDLIGKNPVNTHAADFSSLGNVAGNGKLRLELTMPIYSPRSDDRCIELMGRYQLIDNEINLGHNLPALSKVNGLLAFTQSTFTIEDVSAQVLGGPVTIHSTASPDGGMRIVAAGKVNFDRLHSLKPEQSAGALQLWARFMQGATDWSAVFDRGEKGMDMMVESTLAGAAFLLPEPFSKSAAEVIPFSFARKSIDSDHEVLRFRYGEVVTAEIQRVRGENGHYTPARGVMNFRAASVELPKDAVTLVQGTISALEWDKWRELFDRHNEIAARSGQADRGTKSLLTDQINFNLNIGRLDFLGSRFNEFVLNANKQGGQWHTSVASTEVIGNIDWDSGVKRKAVARLKKLVMPEAVPESDLAAEKKHQPKDWPAIDLRADEFIAREKPLGKLMLLAQQQKDGWHIDKLQITHAESSLLMQGVWQNRIAPFQMQAEAKLQASNIGKFLARLGYPGRIARGEGELEGSLAWIGKPFSIDFPSLSGDLRVTAQRGQFTRFRPGVSKLLGIFDLKSLPRRLTLDFYDVFSQGFGFDDILGDVRITRGVAAIDELQIAGSAAYLAVSGEIDLVEETQALLVKMFPSLGLATPVAGIASMIANQSLKDPFDRVLFNEYAITGTWAEPIVNKSQSSQEIKETQPEYKRNMN
ncbi:YhdP family protein [Nitrosomonas sp. Nm58]|uniref:YhdP family protein n=1 Tax=Nitrosomonas sp. Nm58 TaxID=200126 RepID=UPI000B8378DC